MVRPSLSSITLHPISYFSLPVLSLAVIFAIPTTLSQSIPRPIFESQRWRWLFHCTALYCRFQFYEDCAVFSGIPHPLSDYETENPRLWTRMILRLIHKFKKASPGASSFLSGAVPVLVFEYLHDYVSALRSVKGIRVCRSAITLSIAPSIS